MSIPSEPHLGAELIKSTTEVAHRIGALRSWHAEDPDARAVRFAIELNSAALDRWPEQKAAQYLEEAGSILLTHVEREGVSMPAVRAVLGVLGNRCQLRVRYAQDPAADLAGALAAGQMGVAFLRDAIEAYGEQPAADPAVHAELNRTLARGLAFLSRALADAGQLDDARDAITEAESLVDDLKRDLAEPAAKPDPGIGGIDDLAEVIDLVADSVRHVNGEPFEIEYELWLGNARQSRPASAA